MVSDMAVCGHDMKKTYRKVLCEPTFCVNKKL